MFDKKCMLSVFKVIREKKREKERKKREKERKKREKERKREKKEKKSIKLVFFP